MPSTKKCPKRKPCPPPPGWVRSSEQYWKPHYDLLHQLMAARIRATENGCTIGRETKKEVLQDLINIAVRFMDLATGYQRPEQPPEARAANGPPPFLVNPMMPVLRQFVSPETWADDEMLYRAMDKTWLMCWANSGNGNQHVSAPLRWYTGLPAACFRSDGWVEVIHPDDRKRTIQAFEEGFAMREFFRLPYRMRRTDFQYDWIMDFVTPRFQPDGRLTFVGTQHIIPAPGAPLEALTYAHDNWISRPVHRLA